jgi:hypothetical protein
MFRSLLLALLLSPALCARDPWTAQDKVLEGAFVVATTMDWGQTLDVNRWAAGHACRHEDNPILGMHPSRAAVNTYFVGAILAHALVANQLSGCWRTAWQLTWIGLEVGTVQRNYQLGIRLNF